MQILDKLSLLINMKLKFPDYLSLIGLSLAWVSLILFIYNNPNWAIVVSLIAVLFDFFDGYFARRFHLESDFGRQVDSLIDVVTYLLFSSLIFLKYLTPNLITGAVIGALILVFGVLRLARFNSEGFITIKDKVYYRGLPVAHVYFVVITLYFLKSFIMWNYWFNVLILLAIFPLMISNYKVRKF